jgi:hypothetical protein
MDAVQELPNCKVITHVHAHARVCVCLNSRRAFSTTTLADGVVEARVSLRKPGRLLGGGSLRLGWNSKTPLYAKYLAQELKAAFEKGEEYYAPDAQDPLVAEVLPNYGEIEHALSRSTNESIENIPEPEPEPERRRRVKE